MKRKPYRRDFKDKNPCIQEGKLVYDIRHTIIRARTRHGIILCEEDVRNMATLIRLGGGKLIGDLGWGQRYDILMKINREDRIVPVVYCPVLDVIKTVYRKRDAESHSEDFEKTFFPVIELEKIARQIQIGKRTVQFVRQVTLLISEWLVKIGAKVMTFFYDDREKRVLAPC